MSLFPLARFDLIDNGEADQYLTDWGHYLGPCNRPFGRQSFGLYLYSECVSVAVSASTPNKKCAGYDRQSVVELARLCTHPEYRDLTLVCLRLWRQVAAETWLNAEFQGWQEVVAYVAYQNAIRHSGEIYRHDRWKHAKDVRGGVAGGGHQRGKKYDPKSIWVYPLSGVLSFADGRRLV